MYIRTYFHSLVTCVSVLFQNTNKNNWISNENSKIKKEILPKLLFYIIAQN